MDDDVVVAIIEQLRATPAIVAIVGTRIYAATQVPHDSPFPRGMVGIAAGGSDVWSDGDTHCQRDPWFSVEWVGRNIETAQANKQVQALDALANDALRGTIFLPHLTWLRRRSGLRPGVQTNDNVEYISGGGLWESLREYDY